MGHARRVVPRVSPRPLRVLSHRCKIFSVFLRAPPRLTARGSSCSDPTRRVALTAKRASRGVAVSSRAATTTPRRGARLCVRAAARGGGPSVYVVQKGESLWSIAQKQNVSLEELQRVNYNALGGKDVIYPGQQIVVPGAAARGPSSGGRMPAVPAFAKPTPSSGGRSSSYAPSSSSSSSTSYSSYSSYAPSKAAALPAPRAAKNGSLVTAGAFFLALAVGIYIFKQDDVPATMRFDESQGEGYGDDQYYDEQQYNQQYDQQYDQGYGQQQQGYGQQQQQQRGEWGGAQQQGYGSPPEWNR